MTKHRNIFLIGPMGAGKTSIGRQLAAELHMEFYDSDEVIEERTGADIPWILDLEGEDGFRKRESQVISELTKLQDIVLATGGGTVALADNRAALATNGIVVYLKASLEDQIERTSKSKKRPLADENDVREATLKSLSITHGQWYEDLADLVYSTDDHSVRHVVKEIIEMLEKKGLL